jgi:hypothetical protein
MPKLFGTKLFGSSAVGSSGGDLAINYTSLKVAIADFLGWGRNSEGTGSSWTDDDDYRLDSIIKAALIKVYYPEGGHLWSWMRPEASLTTSAPYSTGTVTVVAGVATLSGGSFPTWAAQGILDVESTQYPVDSWDSATQLTLDDTSVSVDAGTSYVLYRNAYNMESDFAGHFDGDMVFSSSADCMYPPITHVSELMIRRYQQSGAVYDRPRHVALRPKVFEADTGQEWEAVFYPTPSAAFTLNYRYRVEPQMLTSSAPYPMGGPDVGELILQACLAIAEQRYQDNANLHTQLFEKNLQAAIQHDAEAFSPDTLGYNGDRSDSLSARDGVAVHSFEGTYYYDRNQS